MALGLGILFAILQSCNLGAFLLIVPFAKIKPKWYNNLVSIHTSSCFASQDGAPRVLGLPGGSGAEGEDTCTAAALPSRTALLHLPSSAPRGNSLCGGRMIIHPLAPDTAFASTLHGTAPRSKPARASRAQARHSPVLSSLRYPAARSGIGDGPHPRPFPRPPARLPGKGAVKSTS